MLTSSTAGFLVFKQADKKQQQDLFLKQLGLLEVSWAQSIIIDSSFSEGNPNIDLFGYWLFFLQATKAARHVGGFLGTSSLLISFFGTGP